MILFSLFKKKEVQYSLLYRNEKGGKRVRTQTIVGGISDLKKIVEKKGHIFEKAEDVKKIKAKAQSIRWNRKKLYTFTSYFRLELAKGKMLGVMSPKDALSEVYKKTFDPLVYAILLEVNEGKKFSEVIEQFPYVFDTFYVSTIKGFFDKSEKPVEGLMKIEEFLLEKDKIVKQVLSKIKGNLVTLTLIILSSYGIDASQYDSLVENYAGYNAFVPAFTENFHNFIWLLFDSLGIIGLFIVVLLWNLEFIKESKLGLKWSYFLLGIPIYGKILRRRILYTVVDMYIIMKDSGSLLRENLNVIAISMPNEYIKQVILEARKALRAGKPIGKELEDYRFFNGENGEDDDLINAFKSQDMEKAMLSLREMKKEQLNVEIDKILSKLTVISMVAVLVLGGALGGAYFLPIMNQGSIMKKNIKNQTSYNYEIKENIHSQNKKTFA